MSDEQPLTPQQTQALVVNALKQLMLQQGASEQDAEATAQALVAEARKQGEQWPGTLPQA